MPGPRSGAMTASLFRRRWSTAARRGSQFALLPPDNATGNFTKVVQRIPVKIALDDPSMAAQLRPGISVVATVRTAH